MPHILIEYTPNLVDLPFDAMLAAVTRRLADSPEVEDEADLKARVVCADQFRVGLADSRRGFIHVTVRIMAGRTEEAKKDFSQRVADGMLEHMPTFDKDMTVHLSVEVVDIERGSYRKFKLSP
ncbi:5-carboxymethyl-2-hydroxymuconate Delta-isomerase [Pusillimonas sp.]|uniref:5-carboxymethyl-2-hydroxymuconate Delta-isomerase n=1 Tax=Pusillimonas sp. TaxID=3040095 RepID=UPI0037C6B32B